MEIIELFEGGATVEQRDVVKQIEPYFGRPDAFLSMINIPKIGIHPSTGHIETPAAIYAYPLAEPQIWNQFMSQNLPYVGWAKYAAVLIAKPEIAILRDDSSLEDIAPHRAALERLMAGIIPTDVWNDVKDGLKPAHGQGSMTTDHPTAMFYLETSAASTAIILREQSPDVENILKRTGGYGVEASKPIFWNSLLRKIGYDAVMDNGTKFIFTLEPYQTAFLHTGALSCNEIFRNNKSSIYGHKRIIESAAHLFRLIAEKKINTRNALEFISSILEHNSYSGQLGLTGDCPYYGYNPNIRLTHAQVRQMVSWLNTHDSKNVKSFIDRERSFGNYKRGMERDTDNIEMISKIMSEL